MGADVINMSAGVSLWSTLLVVTCLWSGVVGVKRPSLPDPSFVAGKANITVSQGDIATLPCTVQNLGTRQVSWRKMGDEHFLTIGTITWKQDPNIVLEHSDYEKGVVSDWNLVFKEARTEDAGTYECQVIHTNTIKYRVRLNVIRTSSRVEHTHRNQELERTQKPLYRPAISLMGKEYVESGESVYLLCNTTEGSRVPDDVDWFKEGDKIDGEKYPHITITRFRKADERTLVSELMIERAKNTDSGTYICRSSLDQIASLEVTVLVAESTNIKRGSGSSLQTTRAPLRMGENRAVTFTFILGNPFTVTLIVAFISLLTFNCVTT